MGVVSKERPGAQRAIAYPPCPIAVAAFLSFKERRTWLEENDKECGDCCCSELSGKGQMLSVRVQRCRGRRASATWLQLAAGRTEASTKSSCPGNLRCEVRWYLNLNATLPCPGHA